MTKFKKALCLVIALVLCLSVAGCGGDKEASVDEGVTVVSYWSPDTGSKAIMDPLIEEYNNTIGKEKGIKIEYKALADYGQQIDLALESGVGPDIFKSVNSVMHGAKGYTIPLEDIEGGQELLDQYEGFMYPGYFIDTVTGKHYSVPLGITTYGLVYNKDMFVKAGIVDENGEAKPPTTYAEMRECAKKLTNPAKKEYGIVYPEKWAGWFGSDVQNLVPASTGTNNGYDPVTGEYDYSAYVSSMQLIIDMKKDGSVYPGGESLDNDPARARFAEGGIGMKFAASYDVAVFNSQFPCKFDWGVAPLPVEDADNCYRQLMGAGGVGSINSQQSTRDKLDKVFEVYKWLQSSELAKVCYAKGVSLPFRESDLEGVEVEEGLKGWEDFANIMKVSTFAPTETRKSSSPGSKSLLSIFLEEIYTGKITPEEGCAKRTKLTNDGIKTYLEQYPDYDYTKYLVPEWPELMKR